MPCVIDLVHIENDDDLRQRRFEASQRGENPHNITPQITMNPKALQLLRTFPNPVRIIAVTGKARLGKSTLDMAIVRHIMGRETFDARVADGSIGGNGDKFRMSAGDTTITAGVQMWTEPLVRPGVEGSYVVIDTEGTERGNDTLTAQLCVFACLVSTNLVYHIDSSLSNTDLKVLANLATTLDTVSMAAARSEGAEMGDGDGDAFSILFPKLTVASRSVRVQWTDATFGDIPRDDFHLRNPAVRKALKGLFDRRLADVEGDTDHLNETRSVLLKLFPSRDLLFSRPASDRDADALDEGLVPTFLDGENGRPGPTLFATSYYDKLEAIVRDTPPCAAPIAVLVDMLPEALEAINKKVVNLPSIVFVIQTAHATEVVESILEKFQAGISELRKGREADLSVFEGEEIRAATEKCQDALDEAMERFGFVPSVRDHARALIKRGCERIVGLEHLDANQKFAATLDATVKEQRVRLDELDVENKNIMADLSKTSNEAKALREMNKQLGDRIKNLESSGGGKKRCTIL